MPDLSATQLAADLAHIMASLPGAVVSVTINGHAYSALSGPPTDGGVEMLAQGLSPGDGRVIQLLRAALAIGDVPVAHTTLLVVDGMTYRAGSVTADPFGAFLMVQLVNADRGGR